MVRAGAALLFVVATVTLWAGPDTELRPVWSWETAWTARQLWADDQGGSGVAAWTSVSGWTTPGLWAGLGAGVDATVLSRGGFRSLVPQGLVRGGVQVPVLGWILGVPWVGGAVGWAWDPSRQGLWGAVEAGLDVEFRAWEHQYLLVGWGVRSDRVLTLTLGLRDRTTQFLPPKPRMVPGGRPARPVVAPRRVPGSFLTPAPLASLSCEVISGPFSPDGDGVGDELVLRVSSNAPQRIVRWTWSVIAPQSQLFYRQAGGGRLPEEFRWNGLSTQGELVSSATDYTLALEVVDDTGRTYGLETHITTDILLLRDGDRYLIRLPSINFLANSPGLGTPSKGVKDRVVLTLVDQNASVLRRLSEILLRFPQYSITIVGHANLVNWADPAKAREEDRVESRPLSLQRAQSVKDALVKLKLDAARIKVEGAGGARPLFPFGDVQNAWKNRRVDIVLDKTVR